jgi:hypothetical protein
VFPFFWLSHQQPIRVPILPHSCYMSRPSHPPSLNYSNNTWLRVQIMKLFIMQFSPFSCHLISLRSEYPPKHPVLKHPKSMFLLLFRMNFIFKVLKEANELMAHFLFKRMRYWWSVVGEKPQLHVQLIDSQRCRYLEHAALRQTQISITQ